MFFDNNDVNLDFTLLDLADLKNTGLNDKKSFIAQESPKFLTAKEGFLRGNMFKDDYLPYKNLKYIDIVPKSDREAKLYNVMQYSFAINDMNLYLDLHPNDEMALKYMKELIKEEKKAKEDYIKKYGPLTVTEVEGNKFDWIDNPWSWDELGGSIYV